MEPPPKPQEDAKKEDPSKTETEKDKQEKTEKMETDEKNTQPSSNGPNLDMEVDWWFQYIILPSLGTFWWHTLQW